MSLGAPPDGRLLEIVLTDELRREIAEWIETDAQLPVTTAGDFGTPARLSGALSTRRVCVADATLRLLALLERHSVKTIEELPKLLPASTHAHR